MSNRHQQQNYCSYDENYQNLSPVNELEESLYYSNELNDIDENVLNQLEAELIRKQIYEEQSNLQKLKPQLFNDAVAKNRRPVTRQKYYNDKMPYYDEQNCYKQQLQQPNYVPQPVQELYYNPNIDHNQQHQQQVQQPHQHHRKLPKNSNIQQQQQLCDPYPMPSMQVTPINLTSKASLKTRCNIALQRTAGGKNQEQLKQNTIAKIDEYTKTFIQNNKINQRKLNQQSIHKANNNYSMAVNEMELANTKLMENSIKEQQAQQLKQQQQQQQQQYQQQQEQQQQQQQSQNYKQSAKSSKTTPPVKKSPIRQSEECGDCGDYFDLYSYDDDKYGDYKFDDYDYNYMLELEKNNYNNAINQLDDKFYNLQNKEKTKIDEIKQTKLINQPLMPQIQSTGDTIINNCMQPKPRSIILEKLLNSKEKEKQLQKQQQQQQQLKSEEIPIIATTTAATTSSQHQKKTVDNDIKINYHNKNFNERLSVINNSNNIPNDNDYLYNNNNNNANSLDVVNLEKSKNIVIGLIDNELKKLSNDKINEKHVASITNHNNNNNNNATTVTASSKSNKVVSSYNKTGDDFAMNERIKKLRNACFTNIINEVERLQNLEMVTDFTFVKPGSSLSFKTKVTPQPKSPPSSSSK